MYAKIATGLTRRPGVPMSTIAQEVKVVDCDSHLTEMHDLFTKRAPAAYRDRVPRVEEVDGAPTWVVDGGTLGLARGGGVIDRDGNKHPFAESMPVWPIEQVHQAAWDTKLRLQMLDEFGIHAQVLFPNAIGLGGQGLTAGVDDPVLRSLCVEIYNDAMAELQSESNNRFLPMAIMPAWSVDECVREAERAAGLGFRGINMTSDPQDQGSPDLADPAWSALWEVCEGAQLPVHFHIGASNTAMDFFGRYFWPSQEENIKASIGGSMLFINNARVVVNTILSGVFDRHPNLKMVSVESGIGWLPFILETIDYEVSENAPVQYKQFQRKPSEYFRHHWYATFWFEQSQGDLQNLIDKVGEDNILFETDFPHPTCVYPDPLGWMSPKMSTLRPETRRKVMGENALALYRL